MVNSTLITISAIVLGLVLIAFILTACYKKAPSNVALVLSGLKKHPRFLIGTGGIKVPFIERMDKLYLGQVSVDINTEEPVPTSDFINVNIDAIAKVAVSRNPDGLQLAAKNFLNMTPEQISQQLVDTLTGNLREIAGTMDLKSLNNDRDGFSSKIQDSAAKDMEKLGIEILALNIQNITDKEGLIENMGADNTWRIKKDAAVSKATAQKEISVVEAQQAKLANDAKVESDTQIAERNNELAIKKAALKKESDTQQAVADAAYEIQKQEQMKIINNKTIEAEIVKTQKEQELAQEKVKVTQNELKSTVNAKADADKYQTQVNSDASKYKTEIDAQARLEQQKRDAEAKRYQAEQEAAALKAQAEAQKYKMEQEAAGIRAKGEAEAYAIQKKGEAEALALDKKAEAYKKYNGAAIAQMVVDKLPDIVAGVAKPMESIKNLNVYSSDGSTGSQISGNVPVVLAQAFDTIKNATGVDMENIVKANSLDAKVNRNVNISGKDTNIQMITEDTK